mgnify:CR=1 FL=1
MQLNLESISKKVGPQTWLYDMTLAPRSGAVTVLLGATQAGKTSLMRLLSGDLQPLGGTVQMPLGGVFWADLKGPEHDQTTVQACWEQWRTRYPQWNSALLQELSEALDMERHRNKPLYMLSTGSRRKVMIVAALASGATVTLLDQPFVSLDQHSVKTIKAFLREAAEAPDRAWIVADYEAPNDLPLARVLQLP